jgi:hypothetical protein
VVRRAVAVRGGGGRVRLCATKAASEASELMVSAVAAAAAWGGGVRLFSP